MPRCPRCHQQTPAAPCQHCGAWFADGALSTPGEAASATSAVLGAYAVEGVIASGGMGVVLRGQRRQDGRVVAMKAPRSNHAIARQRFTREARALATLNHPNIVSLLDIDATPAGTPLLITEFIPGQTLEQRLQGHTPLSCDEFSGIARSIAEALSHCHRRGIVHRDVKPDNIMLRDKGACLIDFGLALLSHDHLPGRDLLRLTPEGLCLGTPPFAAPEQLRNPLQASIKSDCYSYGMVLDRCLPQVDWHGANAYRRRWQDLIHLLTQDLPQLRPHISDILSSWPQPRSSSHERRLQRAPMIIAATAVVAGIFSAALLITPLLLGKERVEQLSGWLDEDGRGSVVLLLPPGRQIELRPSGDTRIRLSGHGPWSNGPLRLRVSDSGQVSVRVAAFDGQWQLELVQRR